MERKQDEFIPVDDLALDLPGVEVTFNGETG